MGGAGYAPERSSSPLKRRASDLEAEVSGTRQDDITMSSVSEGDSEVRQTPPGSSRHQRGVSVDMLAGETSSVVIETVEGDQATAGGIVDRQVGKLDIPVFRYDKLDSTKLHVRHTDD